MSLKKQRKKERKKQGKRKKALDEGDGLAVSTSFGTSP